MRTRKDIATISYNTPSFLESKLHVLYKNHAISDFLYIFHHKESDERKDHIHLFIRPNTLLDTMELQDFLKEPVPDDPMRPLGCIDFRTSKVDDWILYNLHDPAYLASKGEMREYFYDKDDMCFCDPDSYEEMYYHAFKGSEWAKRNQLLQKLSDGRISPADLILNGSVPLGQAGQLNAFYYMRSKYGLERNGHKNHEDNTFTQ